MSGRKFNHADDLRLIRSVQSFPELFDRRNSYTHLRFRDAWQTIAEQLNKPEDACKGRWRDIRDHFFKLRRRLMNGYQANTRWYLYDKLTFLENVKRKRKWTTNKGPNRDEEDPEPSENTGSHHLVPDGVLKPDSDLEPEVCFKVEEHFISPEYVSLPFIPEERPAVTESQPPTVECEEEDDVDVFMKSIAMTVKRFSPSKRAEAKLKILSVVSEMEFPTMSSYKNTG